MPARFDRALTAGSLDDHLAATVSSSGCRSDDRPGSSLIPARAFEEHQARDKENVSTMSALDTEFAAPPALADRVAMVRAQLEPIRSRRALLDSYRRESLCRLATTAQAAGSAAEVLELAYAMRWLELESEAALADQPVFTQNGLVDE
jgi:hypothetical protein